MSEETSKLDVAEIKREALHLTKVRLRGQHSNNKVIRLCIEIERLQKRLGEARQIIQDGQGQPSEDWFDSLYSVLTADADTNLGASAPAGPADPAASRAG